jgi:glycosyltransferase involved in cell wall biosynthesis
MRVQYEQLYLGLSFRTVHNACADPDEDPRQSSVSRRDGSPVRLVYTGSLTLGHGQSPQSRTPVFFLKALLELLKEGEVSRDGVVVDFYGVHPEGGYRLGDAQQELLDSVVTWRGSVSREKACQAQNDADVLLLFQAQGFEWAVGGKLYEYLMTEKPILACVPESGEAASIIKELSAGLVANPADVAGIKVALKRLVSAPLLDPRRKAPLGPYSLSGAMSALTEVLEAARTAGNV